MVSLCRPPLPGQYVVVREDRAELDRWDLVAAALRAPHLPTDDADTGLLVSFAQRYRCALDENVSLGGLIERLCCSQPARDIVIDL